MRRNTRLCIERDASHRRAPHPRSLAAAGGATEFRHPVAHKPAQ
jgi:hypothetical protein